MPQLFSLAGYKVYFWVNEGDPTEPVHVHISKGQYSGHSTKVWITKSGGCLLCHNNSHIPKHVLNNIMAIIETQSDVVLEKWKDIFGEVTFYC